MEKCEKKILLDILNKFQKNNLYDSKGNQIKNTIQALKLAISLIQNDCKKKSSCAKNREPKITQEGYECEEGFIIQTNRKGEQCCFKDKKYKKLDKKKTSRKSSRKSSRERSRKTSKKKSQDGSIKETNVFSKNHDLSYIENIIYTTKKTQSLGFLGRIIDVITLEDIQKHIENVNDEIEKDKIEKWNKDKENIKIYDTVTINNEKGKGEFLVYFHNKQLALLNFSSYDGLIYPIECIELINEKTKFYQEIYYYNEEKSIIKAIDFFIKGDKRQDYNFFIPLSSYDFKQIANISNIKIENKLINSDNYRFEGLALIDIYNSENENKPEIIIIDTNELEEFVPKSITINIDEKNFNDLKINLSIDII